MVVSSVSTVESDSQEPSNNKLDLVLSRLTSAFPFFVLGSGILGLMHPSTLMWTNRGTLISWMLASVMCATGLTLEKKDFTKVLGQDFAAVPAGVLCQFLIMPLTAFLVGRKMLLNSGIHGPSLFLGLCLVGCAPGGTASNLVSLIAKADVALSVLLTSCSTILASLVTPLLVKLLVGSTIAVSGWALCEATAQVVLVPVVFGMFVNAKAPNLARRVSRFTPFASVLLVSLICGGVVAQNSVMFLQSSTLIPRIVGSVLALHCIGFFVGYMVPRVGLGFSEITSRTISIETGMQNSALAVVLARSIGAPAVASLPGALSATAHSCLGSILAGYWHSRQNENTTAKELSAAAGDNNEVQD
jgi:BASS family bile acid:Na+ symporter